MVGAHISPRWILPVPYKKHMCDTVHMLSLDFIRQPPEQVRAALRRRCDPQGIEEILRLAEQRRGLATRCDGLYSELKQLREQVRAAPVEPRAEPNKRVKATARDIRQLELQVSDSETT